MARRVGGRVVVGRRVSLYNPRERDEGGWQRLGIV